MSKRPQEAQKAEPSHGFEPPFPRLSAAIVCTIAALTLLWPLLTGQIMLGGARSDMYIAGYAFRLFGAETFKATGSIPQWNPYLFGGLPYIGAMHGDIFYPTAWLRWIIPVDLAITWGMAIHFLLAGWFTYLFGRALGLSWSGAVTAGVAYELSGIVASQMSPGHDGKLFVSALTPLAFWMLLLAIRDGRRWAYGVFALVTALTVLGHYHMSYFLLLALGLWTLYLAFWDRTRRSAQNPWACVALSALAVGVGIGITSLQILPFLEYLKYSPRADGGPDTGFAFATSYAFPPAEIFSLILPQFNGVLDHYWGSNPIKFHTEYIGLLPLLLAALALGDRAHRRLVVTFAIGFVVFLLFSWGGYSPLYRALFNLLPYLNKIRAMGMVFFLPAFFLALLAGIGLDRLLGGAVPRRTLVITCAGFALFALLGVAGGLQSVAETLALPERADAVQANAGELRDGAVRLLASVLCSVAALWSITTRRLPSIAGTAVILLLLAADLWGVDRQFYTFSPRASELFRDDPITSYLKRVPPPYRVLDAGAYGESILMGYRIPNALGYHGFELRAYDELGGRAEGWRQLLTPNLLSLLSVRYLILPGQNNVPGFHSVVPQTMTTTGSQATLYEMDSLPPYARMIPVAAKVSDDSIAATVADPRFPYDRIALFSDTSTVVADSIVQPLRQSSVRANVQTWSPGRMEVLLDGADPRPGHLLISENWYKDWHATVDGAPATTRRADHALLSVDVPAGAKRVELWFDAPTYARGKLVSAAALVVALLMIVGGVAVDRRRPKLPPREGGSLAGGELKFAERQLVGEAGAKPFR